MKIWQELLCDAFRRPAKILEQVLPDIPSDMLDRQPAPGCNSIGWLAWHASRIQDAQIAPLKGVRQVWLTEGWATRYGRGDSPYDTGFGHSDSDVNGFRSPNVEIVLGYSRSVLRQTEEYICSIDEKTLYATIDVQRFDPPPTVAVRLVSIVNDCTIHIGQIAYLAGLFKRI